MLPPLLILPEKDEIFLRLMPGTVPPPVIVPVVELIISPLKRLT